MIFTLAGLTDWLDGYLARKLNLTSRFGAFLDPVADKLMVATALVLILWAAPTHEMPLVPGHETVLAICAAIIIGREIVISALREWMAELGERHAVAVHRHSEVQNHLSARGGRSHAVYLSYIRVHTAVRHGLCLRGHRGRADHLVDVHLPEGRLAASESGRIVP